MYRGGVQNILNLISFATPVYDKTKLRPHTDHSIIKKKKQAQTKINCKELRSVFSFALFYCREKHFDNRL